MLHLSEWPRTKTLMKTYAGEDEGSGEHFSGNTPPLLVGVQTGTASLDFSMQFLRKLANNLRQDPALPLLGTYPRMNNHSAVCFDQVYSLFPLFFSDYFLSSSTVQSLREWNYADDSIVSQCQDSTPGGKKEGWGDINILLVPVPKVQAIFNTASTLP